MSARRPPCKPVRGFFAFRMRHAAWGGAAAFTLGELAAMIAVLAAALVLGLGLMVESDHAAAEITRHETAAQYCQAALDEAVRTLRGAVAPADLTMKDHVASALRFTSDALTICVVDKTAPGGIGLVTFANARDDGRSPAGIVRRSVAASDGATRAARGESLGGTRPDRVKPAIRFGYAAAPHPGARVEYLDAWTSAGLPALVQVTVTARLDGSVRALPDIALQTAVIPGGLPPLRPAAKSSLPVENKVDFVLAPTPTPTPAPTPTPEPAPAPKGAEGVAVATGGGAAGVDALDVAAPTGPAIKTIKAAAVRVVLKPEKLDEVKEAPARR